jgi:murein DD-endopeptidase MepM/ murein hydrolase activator NlpD
MRARHSVLPLFLLTAACATPGLPTPRTDEVAPFPPTASTPRRMPSTRGTQAACSPELNALLADFSEQARRHRDLRPSGELMPDAQVKDWLELTGQFDHLLARPAAKTPPRDLLCARQALDAELEKDTRFYGELPAEVVGSVLERRAKLTARLEETRPEGGKARLARSAFAWPVEPVTVTSPFGRRRHPFRHEYVPHLGVDLAARRGQEISVAADGVVLRAQWTNGHGYHVDVDHGGGVMTRYSHLSAMQVKAGHELKQGDVVGLAGDTGLTTGVHLHFELWRGDQAMDPLEELDAPRRAVAVSNR